MEFRYILLQFFPCFPLKYSFPKTCYVEIGRLTGKILSRNDLRVKYCGIKT